MPNLNQKEFSRWKHPKRELEISMDHLDFSKLFVLTIEIKVTADSSEFSAIKAKAPINMSLGEWFYKLLLDYNLKFGKNPIEIEFKENIYYDWFFYRKPRYFWHRKKPIDPELTLEDNGIDENNIYVACRVPAWNFQQDLPIKIAVDEKESTYQHYKLLLNSKDSVRFLLESKLLIIGDGGAGKTTFARKLQDNKAALPPASETTLGISISRWGFKIPPLENAVEAEHQFNVNIWDFGGKTIYQGTHQIFFSDKSFYVLVADSRGENTDFAYWLNAVEQTGGVNCCLIIVINKKFGHGYKFDETKYRKKFGNILKEIITVDLQNDEKGIGLLCDKIKRHLLNLPDIGDMLPPFWEIIRNQLLNITTNYISFDRFDQICKAAGVTDIQTIELLCKDFHRLGIFINYFDDPVLRDTIFLNSNWILRMVYRIMDNELVKSKLGCLNDDDLTNLLEGIGNHYEKDKLCQLMSKYGMMFQVPGEKKYIIPAHLPAQIPYKKWRYENDGIHLNFIYEFDQYMPKGITARLIVGLHHYILQQELAWDKGLNISLNGAHAEIIEGYEGTNQFIIRIAGKNKSEFLAVIRDKFAEIIRPFSGLPYRQLVPCVCEECLTSNTPAFHDYSLLTSFLLEDVDGSQCRKTGKMVDVQELLQLTSPNSNHKTQTSIKTISTKTIRIFLASSSELKEDRREFEILINRENKQLNEKGIFIHLDIWEDFIDSMSSTCLQDEYNKAILQCDIFCCLFFTKVGKYTAEEFEKAFQNFKEFQKPIIYTYFKDGPIFMQQIKREDLCSRFDFEEKLKSLGHFPTSYKTIEDLKYQVKAQLSKILKFI